jgi:integrase
MGTVYWREDRQSYYISYAFRGRRYRRKVGRSKKLAETVLRKVEADIINRKYDLRLEKKGMTFNQLAGYWLENYSRAQNSASTHAKNEERLKKHLKPFFGKMDLRQITPKTIDEYVTEKRKEVKPATVNRTLAILSKMFNDAVRWEVMESNPMKKVSKLHEEEVGFDYWTEEEAQKFLACSKDDGYPIFCCALNTGMRIGEILGLRWDAVSLKERIITVERSRLGSTKTKRIRHVYMNDALYPVVRDLEKRRRGEYVFAGKGGEMRKDIRGGFEAAIKKSGVRRIRIHDLRHTFASHFMMKGGNILTLQKILGHSTLAMTLRYAHLARDFMKEEMGRVDFSRPKIF